jgi:hypothetical protein
MSATSDEFERLRLTVGVVTAVEDFLGAVYSGEHGVVLLRPDRDVEPGSAIG